MAPLLSAPSPAANAKGRPAHPPAATQAQEGIEAGGPEEDERSASAEPHRGQRHARQGGIESSIAQAPRQLPSATPAPPRSMAAAAWSKGLTARAQASPGPQKLLLTAVSQIGKGEAVPRPRAS